MAYELEKVLAMLCMILRQPTIMFYTTLFVVNEVWLTLKVEIRNRKKSRLWDSPDYVIDTSRVNK